MTKIAKWQLEELLALAKRHDTDQTDVTTAYVDVENIERDGERLLECVWEHGPREVLFSDGSVVTDEYPPEEA